MKQYKLKEADRQKALEKALPGFTLELQRACEHEFADPFDYVNITNEEGGWSLRLHKILIKEVIQYDPNAWNNYPEVTPPEKVKMRVEIIFRNPQPGELMAYSGCAVFNGSYFVDSNTQKGIRVNDLDDVRFRPWE